MMSHGLVDWLQVEKSKNQSKILRFQVVGWAGCRRAEGAATAQAALEPPESALQPQLLPTPRAPHLVPRRGSTLQPSAGY